MEILILKQRITLTWDAVLKNRILQRYVSGDNA